MTQLSKTLWVVNYDDVEAFLDQALAAGATGVAIRTDNDVARAIPKFHDKGLMVFGWRWPSAHTDAAMKEADKVVALLGDGLDGYYVDPEGAEKARNGSPLKPYDWDQRGLDSLAEAFCDRIRSAAPEREFGTTSHYRASAAFPKLPWVSILQILDGLTAAGLLAEYGRHDRPRHSRRQLPEIDRLLESCWRRPATRGSYGRRAWIDHRHRAQGPCRSCRHCRNSITSLLLS